MIELIVACIPAYNEERELGPVIIKASKVVDKIIVCDDGSSDLTSEVARKLGCELIVHSQRKGKGNAIKDLFVKALELGADIIVTLDGDGQHHPEDIPNLINPIIKDDADMVVGSRFLGNSKEVPFYRIIGNNMFTSFTRLMSNNNFKDLSDSQSGFRAYSKKVLEYVKVYESGMSIDSEILVSMSDGSFKVVEIPIQVSYNGNEGSTFGPINHGFQVFYFIFKMMSEQKPFLFFGLPGLVMVFVSFFLGVRVVNIFLESGDVAIGTSLISVGIFVVGFIAITTAIILKVIVNNIKKNN